MNDVNQFLNVRRNQTCMISHKKRYKFNRLPSDKQELTIEYRKLKEQKKQNENTKGATDEGKNNKSKLRVLILICD